jgi:hypothetical protein
MVVKKERVAMDKRYLISLKYIQLKGRVQEEENTIIKPWFIHAVEYSQHLQ